MPALKILFKEKDLKNKSAVVNDRNYIYVVLLIYFITNYNNIYLLSKFIFFLYIKYKCEYIIQYKSFLYKKILTNKKDTM
jgi:hypothetical protein